MRNRTEEINVRVYKTEKNTIRRKAKKCGMNMSEYLRTLGTGTAVCQEKSADGKILPAAGFLSAFAPCHRIFELLPLCGNRAGRCAAVRKGVSAAPVGGVPGGLPQAGSLHRRDNAGVSGAFGHAGGCTEVSCTNGQGDGCNIRCTQQNPQ